MIDLNRTSSPVFDSALSLSNSTKEAVGLDYAMDNTTFLQADGVLNTTDWLELNVRNPVLGVVLGMFCVITVFGNLLVIIAVYRERYLHSVTNYFIVSLAIADLWVGAVVMPFGVVDEMLNNQWIFGQDWCDIWHSFDVLGSTASILHLCVISLDRYWAITDPITYPCRMTPKKAAILITVVWICSFIISFPAIAWWRAVQPESSKPLDKCIFTEHYGWYLVFSSTISFYGPLLVMVYTYYRVYKAAKAQTKCLKQGIKHIQTCNGDGREVEVTLRIHRGGTSPKTRLAARSNESLQSASNGKSQSPDINRHNWQQNSRLKPEGDPPKSPSCGSRQPLNAKNFSFSRKLSKFAKEKTAAKTLGIVMGVFILCWLPFFVINALLGLCGARCVPSAPMVGSITTWLGWINSGMNPIIYACRSKDFRRAFIKILFCSKVNVGTYTRRRDFREVMHDHESDLMLNPNYSSTTNQSEVTSV